MVKKIFLVLLFLFFLVSCEVFFRTPFPEELIFFNDSVLVKGIEPFYNTRIYLVDDYVFLYVDEKENPDKLYIFTKDLKQVFLDHDINNCNTFAMRAMDGDYFIGSWRYHLSEEYTGRYGLPEFAPAQTLQPPFGFGFFHAGSNYFIWWDDLMNHLKYIQYTYEWGSVFYDEIPLDMYGNLEAVYYDKDHDESKSRVVLFFNSAEEDDEIVVAGIFADSFEGPLSLYIAGAYPFLEFSFSIRDINPKEYFFTGNGVVIREHENRYVRYNLKGELVREYTSGMDGYSDTYGLDGKTRYVFSGKYMRLMKTGVWW
ncbi:MAG: hypothetical protein JXB88_07935 [Spirochaetales bacterium]|nr:hypothetical protein [Spirochaetales bacterium]